MKDASKYEQKDFFNDLFTGLVLVICIAGIVILSSAFIN
jgi:hypothetical protein